jgi:hypothetical protein
VVLAVVLRKQDHTGAPDAATVRYDRGRIRSVAGREGGDIFKFRQVYGYVAKPKISANDGKLRAGFETRRNQAMDAELR